MSGRAEPSGQRPKKPSVSIVIPTLGRESVLVETVAHLLSLEMPAEEVVVVDQSPSHEPATNEALGRWEGEGLIRWLRLSRASIPCAMNTGLREARSVVVLFLDDDIVPGGRLVEAHREAQREVGVVAVTGMVLQPGEEASLRNGSPPSAAGLRRDLEFDYTGPRRREIWNVMAGNLSVRREAAIACGGFDEAFVGVAYRFETEFCRRLRRNGGRVFYEPAAVIRHLKAPSGGTRIWGFHKVSARPEHGVGDYYFAFLEARGRERWAYVGRRFLRETLSRFHRRRPWYIPVKALGEVRAFLWALCLARKRRSRA